MGFRIVAATVVAFCFPLVAHGQSTIFRTAMLADTNGRPSGIVLEDFNDDAAVDAVVSNSDTGTVTLLFGFNDGELSRIGSVAAGNVPSALVGGDFDGDQLTDLITANVNDATVSFLKGRLGDFCQDMGLDFCFEDGIDAVAANVGAGPIALATANLNGDAMLDLVVANEGETEGSAGTVALLRGLGDGTFMLQGSLDADLATRGVAVGRLDGDAQLDIVAMNNGVSTLSTFFGSGNFAFVIGPTISTGPAPKAVALADLNGDNIADILTADSNADAVSVYLNNGNRTFQARTMFAVGTDPNGVIVGDLNDDGDADVLVTNNRSGDVSVLLGDGSGQLAPARHFVVGEEPLAVGLAPVTDDGLIDLVTANSDSTVATLLGEGDGRFIAVENIAAGGGPEVVTVGDMDNDALPDLIAAHSSGEVLVFRARADGGFHPPLQVTRRGRALDVAAADFNGDDRLDVAVVDNENQNVAVVLATATGFNPTVQTFSTGPQPSAIATGDFAGAGAEPDGFVDIAVASIGPPGLVSVFRGRGDGTFLGRENANTQTLGDTPISMVSGDLNCDGADDVLVANNVSSSVSVMLSNLDGTFDVATPLTNLGQGPAAVVLGDFNRDGQPDFAVGNQIVPDGNNSVHVFAGSRTPCNGTFAPIPAPMPNPTGRPLTFGGELVSALAARDFTGDGLVDVAAVYQTSNAIQVFELERVGAAIRFDATDAASVSRMPLSIAAGDFDGDGRYDAVTSNNDASANNLSVLTNATMPAVLRGDGNGDGRVSAADVTALLREVTDGDGKQAEDVAMRPPQSRGGVDANGDGRVDAQDAVAHVVRIFI